MLCCLGHALTDGHESAFSVDVSAITFGPGVLAEVGTHARALGCKRVALFTDPRLATFEHVAIARTALLDAGLDAIVYDQVHVEPTNESFVEAARFAASGAFDGYVSVGGGSVIDTCKAAMLYATHPADFYAYVNAPIGRGVAVPGPLPPHIACPTTCGTGSECTGIAVFDDLPRAAKTGIASRRLRPTLALVDPHCTHTLPANVVAASGFDVLCHAIESYTARPFARRVRPVDPTARPMSQGSNPWSDLGSREALRLSAKYLLRAVADDHDAEAREALTWAATLAGIAFGNAGVHLPHAMSYAVAGGVRDFRMPGYPDAEPMVPHGISVVVNAPSVFRFTASVAPQRHLEVAADLGVDVRGAAPEDAGALVSDAIIALMRTTGAPNGVGGVGYGESDLDTLVRGTVVQTRLTANAPREVDAEAVRSLFVGALRYW
ncbi:MAG: hydroxyacid-oxoacid transhydrogenase [Polyangiales bacterium]